jgi:pimeloyl-ACP methyl ester carboxylesterase
VPHCHRALPHLQAFLVGKDWGAFPAYEFTLQHPDRTRGVECLGIPFSPVPIAIDTLPKGFYVLRWRVRSTEPLTPCITSEKLSFLLKLTLCSWCSFCVSSVGAWQGGGRLRPVRREARGAHRLRALLPRRDPDC